MTFLYGGESFVFENDDIIKENQPNNFPFVT